MPSTVSVHSNYSINGNDTRQRSGIGKRGENIGCTPNLAELRNLAGQQSESIPTLCKEERKDNLETTGTSCPSLQVAACLHPTLRDFPKPPAHCVVDDSELFCCPRYRL
jgi:hypothetical protein